MPHLQSSRFSGFSAFTPTAFNFHAISLLQNQLQKKNKEQQTGPLSTGPVLSTGAQQRTQAKGQASTILSGDFGISGAGVGRGTVAFKTLSGF